MADAIQLWGVGTPRTLRPIWMAEELGLAYTLHPIGPRTGETQTAAFTRLAPKQKIPVLQHGARTLSESLVICRYLQSVFPHPALPVPQTPLARAREDEWCAFIYGEIDETALYVLRRHFDLAAVYGDAPAAVEASRAYLARQWAVLEAPLEARATLLETGFGLADIALVSCLDWALFYKVPLPETLRAYRDAIAERAAYRKAMAVNYAALREARAGATDGAA